MSWRFRRRLRRYNYIGMDLWRRGRSFARSKEDAGPLGGGGRRPRGRPKRRDKDYIGEDIRVKRITEGYTWVEAENSEQRLLNWEIMK